MAMNIVKVLLLGIGILMTFALPRILLARHIARKHGTDGYAFNRVFAHHRAMHAAGSHFGHIDDEAGELANQIVREGAVGLAQVFGVEFVNELMNDIGPELVRDGLKKSIQEGRISYRSEEEAREEWIAASDEIARQSFRAATAATPDPVELGPIRRLEDLPPEEAERIRERLRRLDRGMEG